MQISDLGKCKRNLTNMVPNAWEPILEKYLGNSVVVERGVKDELLMEMEVFWRIIP